MKYKSKIEFHDLDTRMSSPRQKIFSEKEKFQIIKSMIIWNPSFFMLHTNHLVQDFYRWATNFHK